MSLLQDERLVSSRLKKSEQIVNVKKMKQLLPTTFRIMSFSVIFNGLLQNIAYFKIRLSQLFL